MRVKVGARHAAVQTGDPGELVEFLIPDVLDLLVHKEHQMIDHIESTLAVRFQQFDGRHEIFLLSGRLFARIHLHMIAVGGRTLLEGRVVLVAVAFDLIRVHTVYVLDERLVVVIDEHHLGRLRQRTRNVRTLEHPLRFPVKEQPQDADGQKIEQPDDATEWRKLLIADDFLTDRRGEKR